MKSKIVVALVVALAVVVLIIVMPYMLRIPQSREKPIRLKVFSGVYAIYSGKVFAFFTTQSMVIAIHVVEYNETHATLTIYSNMFGQRNKEHNNYPTKQPVEQIL